MNMKFARGIAAVAALLVVVAISPAQALVKGDCIVDLTLTGGTKLGLSPDTRLTVQAARRVRLTFRPSSASDAERGAVSGKLPLVLSAGAGGCNFTDGSLDRRSPGNNALRAALRRVSVGGGGNSTYGLFVTDFAGRSTTRRPATSTTDFSFKNGVALDLSATTSLSSRYIRIFRPTAAFTGGVAALQLNYSRPLGRQGAVSGGAGFNSTALSGLGAARRASLCALSLTRISSKATFTLLCQFFTLQFPSFTNGDLTTSLAFRQSTGRGAFSVRATGLLTSAYVY